MLGASGDLSLKNRYSLRRTRIFPQGFEHWQEFSLKFNRSSSIPLNMPVKTVPVFLPSASAKSSRAWDSQGGPHNCALRPAHQLWNPTRDGLEGRLTVSTSSFPKRKLFLILAAVETAYINIISTSPTTSSFSFFKPCFMIKSLAQFVSETEWYREGVIYGHCHILWMDNMFWIVITPHGSLSAPRAPLSQRLFGKLLYFWRLMPVAGQATAGQTEVAPKLGRWRQMGPR